MNKKQYTILLSLLVMFFFSRCGNGEQQQAISDSRHVLGVESYENMNSQGQGISFQPIITDGKFANQLEVSIIHGNGESPWNDLIFTIYLDQDSYYAINENYSFFEKPITSLDSITHFILDFKDFDYTSLSLNKKISVEDFLSNLSTTKKIRLGVTMHDPSLLRDMYRSSSLRHGSIVEMNFK